MSIKFFLLAVAFIVAARAATYCNTFSADGWNTNLQPLNWEFGLKDGGGSKKYAWYLLNDYFTQADLQMYYLDNSIFYQSYWTINQAPIIGGKNMISINGAVDPSFVPTANFTCLSASSGIWGPAYPDFRSPDGLARSRNPNLETYVHYSAPNETSYIRNIVFIKNTGSKAERVRLNSLTWTNAWCADRSPKNTEGRYFTCHYLDQGDDGVGDQYYPNTIHVRGAKGRDQTANAFSDMYEYDVQTNYLTMLEPGQQMGFMEILSIGANITSALANAAEIDAEPPFIFHDLTADQLAMIRNWGGCQAIIGPTANVTITPPSQCSSGLTSDFTVQASSSRTDLTSGFTHRVLGPLGIEIVPAQSGTTLTVPNNIGTVTHQLWYKECLVKETPFDSCTTA